MMDQFTGQAPCPYCGFILDRRQIRCPRCWKVNPFCVDLSEEEKEKADVTEKEKETAVNLHHGKER